MYVENAGNATKAFMMKRFKDSMLNLVIVKRRNEYGRK